MFIHKTDTLSGVFGSILWGFFSIIAMYILTARSSSVFGWSRTDLFVLVGVFNILIGGIYRMFTSTNFDRFVYIIQRGELDGLLLKPLNLQFALSCWYISYHYILRVILAVMYTVFVLGLSHVPITFFSVLSFLFLGVFGLITLYSFWFLIMTSLIWFPDLYNLTELLYTTDNFSRYPPQILWAIRLSVFIIFFPVTLTVSIPAKALLHTATTTDAVMLVAFGVGLLYCSGKFWQFALRYYTSANS